MLNIKYMFSDHADSATPDVMVSEDVPMLHEVTRAI